MDNKNKIKKRVFIVALSILLVVCIGVGGFFGYKNILNPLIKYNKAKSLLTEEKYEEAIDIFKGLKSYKDSKDLLLHSRYENAKELYNSKKIDESLKIFIELKDYDNSLEFIKKIEEQKLVRAKVGDVVKFGNYKQKNRMESVG